MSSLLKYGNFYWEECKKESFRNSENLFIHLIYALCHSIQVPSHLYNGIANITLDPSYHRAEILCLKKSQSLNQVSRAHRASHWQAWDLHGSACTLELFRLGRIGYSVSDSLAALRILPPIGLPHCLVLVQHWGQKVVRFGFFLEVCSFLKRN